MNRFDQNFASQQRRNMAPPNGCRDVEVGCHYPSCLVTIPVPHSSLVKSKWIRFEEDAATYEFADYGFQYNWNKLWGTTRCGYFRHVHRDSDRFVWRRETLGGGALGSRIEVAAYAYDNHVPPIDSGTENAALFHRFDILLETQSLYRLQLTLSPNATTYEISDLYGTVLGLHTIEHTTCDNPQRGTHQGLYFGGAQPAPSTVTCCYFNDGHDEIANALSPHPPPPSSPPSRPPPPPSLPPSPPFPPSPPPGTAVHRVLREASLSAGLHPRTVFSFLEHLQIPDVVRLLPPAMAVGTTDFGNTSAIVVSTDVGMPLSVDVMCIDGTQDKLTIVRHADDDTAEITCDTQSNHAWWRRYVAAKFRGTASSCGCLDVYFEGTHALVHLYDARVHNVHASDRLCPFRDCQWRADSGETPTLARPFYTVAQLESAYSRANCCSESSAASRTGLLDFAATCNALRAFCDENAMYLPYDHT